MVTKIFLSPWKKQRLPRRLKKKYKVYKPDMFLILHRLIRTANFGRFAAYKSAIFWGNFNI